MEKFHCSTSRTTPLVFVPYDKVDFVLPLSTRFRCLSQRLEFLMNERTEFWARTAWHWSPLANDPKSTQKPRPIWEE